MFTDCPSCERLLRIRAAQLKAADGWVKCGYCAETFYALERLHDAPVKTPRPDLLPEEAAAKLPAADIETEQVEETVARQDSNNDVAVETATESELPDDLPPILESEADETARSYSRLFWPGLMVILLMIALAQVAWFNRDWLLREYPQLTPWAEKFCERLQCDLFRFRDLSAINLVNRDVRAHPRYRNAVLVSATIVNNAELAQSFPEIELVIYDTNARVISHGRFTAAEYLEPGINPAAGMPPGAPVHLVMELAGAVKEAAGFEFRLH